MIDWSRIVGFDWDEGNSTKNLLKHQVEKAEAEEIFANQPLLISVDVGHSEAESRFQALGTTNTGRRLFAAFTLRNGGTLVRIISVRDMKRAERYEYAQAP
jgi:uncharacterized DUF497 family protein